MRVRSCHHPPYHPPPHGFLFICPCRCVRPWVCHQILPSLLLTVVSTPRVQYDNGYVGPTYLVPGTMKRRPSRDHGLYLSILRTGTDLPPSYQVLDTKTCPRTGFRFFVYILRVSVEIITTHAIQETTTNSARHNDHRPAMANCVSPFEDRSYLEIPEGILSTVLYCTNWKVDKENCGKDYYMGKCPNERPVLTNELSSLLDNLASPNFCFQAI
jgi:hypothetical protein